MRQHLDTASRLDWRRSSNNTYSNYQEATRSFWRQTVLPLVNRTAKALSAWLSPAYDGTLELRPDLDCIDALSPERDALWSRLEKTTFLTPDEKRTAIGYAPLGGTPFAAGLKCRPDQARDDHGRWEDEGCRPHRHPDRFGKGQGARRQNKSWLPLVEEAR